MVYFKTKKPTFGKYWKENITAFYCHLVYFTYSHLVYFVAFMAIWYTFSRFGMLYHKKSGNPAPKSFLAVPPFGNYQL
jgi:hypothetical protein